MFLLQINLYALTRNLFLRGVFTLEQFLKMEQNQYVINMDMLKWRDPRYFYKRVSLIENGAWKWILKITELNQMIAVELRDIDSVQTCMRMIKLLCVKNAWELHLLLSTNLRSGCCHRDDRFLNLNRQQSLSRLFPDPLWDWDNVKGVSLWLKLLWRVQQACILDWVLLVFCSQPWLLHSRLLLRSC